MSARAVEIIPPGGWRVLWSSVFSRDWWIAGVLFNLRSWTLGVDFVPRGVAVSLGPIGLYVGHHPEDPE